MNKLFIGIMSGASFNTIDIVAAEFTDEGPMLHASAAFPICNDYKNKYLNIINSGGSSSLMDIGELNSWTGSIFADAINQFIADKNVDKNRVMAIGNHGQTIWHAPKGQWPFSMQLSDNNVIVEKTGIATVGDFRGADIAAGGQGAPLAPAFHKAVFASTEEPRCIVNIGTYSNITILENGKYLGFNTGPGNCLIDHWVYEHFNEQGDRDGTIAKTGRIIPELLNLCLNDPYFTLPPPKSTGREYFNAAWLKGYLGKCSSQIHETEDVLLTLLHLTAHSIINSIKTYAHQNTKVFISGSGAQNYVLLDILSTLLGKRVKTTTELGIDPGWVEAILFAWLAKQRLMEEPIDFTEITGSRHPVILGALYQPYLRAINKFEK